MDISSKKPIRSTISLVPQVTLLVLLLISLAKNINALYVPPNVHSSECDWAYVGSEGVAPVYYKGYLYVLRVARGDVAFLAYVEIIDLDSGKAVGLVQIINPESKTFVVLEPMQIMICPKEARLIVLGAGFAVFDITDPLHPKLLYSSLKALKG